MTEALDDLMDRIVAEYADRIAEGGAPDAARFVERVPAEHRPALGRCLRLIQAGISSAPRTSAVLTPGATLDKYRIVREIGRGGMSIVYLATQLDLNRSVALKLLRPALAVDGRHVDRFKREAHAVARVQHPHIVQVYAVGEARGLHFLAMEYVEGKNFAQVLSELAGITAERTGTHRKRSHGARAAPTAEDLARAAGVASIARDRATFEEALAAWLAPAVRAIGVAHELGIVHRDVKPSNILIHKDGRAMIADFGLAKGDGDPALSLTGEPLGTPYYMSPEQAAITEAPVDERTDVYSLGITLYEALTGQRPYEGDTPLRVLEAIRSSTPARVSRLAPDVSREAEAVVERAMAREPAQRYARALDLASDLAALAEGRATQARAEVGGFGRQVARELRRALSGRAYEYRSRARLFGLPLVHVHWGPNPKPGQLRIAKGWLALGDVALGGIACGGTSATGALAFGGIASGGICFGGISIGLVSFAGVALGVLAHGGVAAGYAAFGGVAAGKFVAGGLAYGSHVITERFADEAAVAFFTTYAPWVMRFCELTH